MTPYSLTPKQRQCLEFIIAHIAAHRVAPSYDDIKDGLGLKSKSGVHRLIEGLVDRGWVKRRPNKARSITVINHDLDGLGDTAHNPSPEKTRSNNWHSSLLLEEMFSQSDIRAVMSINLKRRVASHIRDIKLGVSF